MITEERKKELMSKMNNFIDENGIKRKELKFIVECCFIILNLEETK